MTLSGAVRAMGLTAIFVAGVADARISATASAVTDYDFRGISQTAHDTAPQGSVDWASESGWYLGAWGSKINLGPRTPNLEVDLYGGYRQALGESTGIDFGSVTYTFHAPGGHDLDYIEFYTGVSFPWATAKLFFSPKFGGNAGGTMLGGGVSAFYLTGDANYPVAANVSLIAHAGYSFGNYWDKQKDRGIGRPYMDWAAGLGYTHGHFGFALRWIDGSELRESGLGIRNILSTKARAVLSVSTSFPWRQAAYR